MTMTTSDEFKRRVEQAEVDRQAVADLPAYELDELFPPREIKLRTVQGRSREWLFDRKPYFGS